MLGGEDRVREVGNGVWWNWPNGATVGRRLNHPGCTLGYRLTANGKVLAYTTDNEPFGKGKRLGTRSNLPATRF
jgi:hypothetical protein